MEKPHMTQQPPAILITGGAQGIGLSLIHI